MARQGWTVSEAARALGISDKTIRRHIKSGQLKAWMEDGQWLIEKAGKERTEGRHEVDSEERVGRHRVDSDQTMGRQRVDTGERAARQASSADRSTLHATIGLLKQQLEEKDRQIGELHVLLREAQGQIQKMLPMPSRRHWWNPGTWFR